MNSINAEKKYSRKGGSSTRVGASGLERVLGEDLAHSLGQDLMQGRKRFYIRGAASAKGWPQGAPEVTRSSKQVIVTGNERAGHGGGPDGGLTPEGQDTRNANQAGKQVGGAAQCGRNHSPDGPPTSFRWRPVLTHSKDNCCS